MTTLTGSYPGNTYKQLLQIGSGNVGLSASFQTVQDGDGASSVLQLSTTAAKINATTITINGQTLTLTATSSVGGTNTGDQTSTGTANEITIINGSTSPVIGLASALLFSGKTITGGTFSTPIFSGTIVGTYTLAGTPTINNSTINTPNISAPDIDGGRIGNTTPVTIAKVDNITIDGNTISTTNSNGNLVVTPNGTGDIQLGGDCGVKDSSGNYLVDFTKIATAVNYWVGTNYSTGSGPQWLATGSDTNISGILQGKGNLGIDLYAGATGTTPLRLLINGTAKRQDHNINTLTTTRTVTWPDRDLTFPSTAIITSVVDQVFVASGTYTPTAGMKYCIIELVGGGAGGGGVDGQGAGTSAAASGGGGGGYARARYTAAEIGASQAVTIGAGGAGGTAGANAGTAGGTTSVGSLISATGGAAGQPHTGSGTAATTTGNFGGAGTVSSGVGIGIQGGSGGHGMTWGAVTVGASGIGGSSFFGGGALAVVSSGAGTNAVVYGAGGSGATAFAVATNFAGGNGTAGVVIVHEYIGI